MKRLEKVAAQAVAAATIVFGVTAASLSGAALVNPSSKPVTHAIHSNPMRTITCVRGKVVKKVTAANPKCPAGWSPVYTSYTFNASYTGKISILWNSSGPSKATVTGTGKGTNFGLTGISGSGTSTATSQVDPINGTGVLTGYLQSLHLKFATNSTATATGGSAPTTVIVSGNATVTSGTGRFAWAIGTLKVSGTFNIQSTSGSEKDTFNATLKGVVKVQK